MHYLCMFALMLNVGILSCNIYGVVAMQIYQVSLFVECERQMMIHCLCRRYMHKLWNSYYIFIFQVRNGHIKRITDNDIQSLVLEIVGTNVSTTYITCPADPKKTLGIKLPFLVMIIKNLKKYFTFEVQVLDDKNVRRRFRASNYQSTTRVKPFICTMPMRLDDGWNQIQFNLSDFTRRAYGTNYIETLRVQIHANCRIRRVYFSDRLYSEDELPAEFKLYLPVQNKAKA